MLCRAALLGKGRGNAVHVHPSLHLAIILLTVKSCIVYALHVCNNLKICYRFGSLGLWVHVSSIHNCSDNVKILLK